MVDETTHYWLALSRVEGLGVRGAHKLVERAGSPAAIYHASLAELERCGLPGRVAQAILAGAGLKESEAQVNAAAKAECTVVSCASSDYPPLLKQIADPPLALYVRGDTKALCQFSVAMVGTRRPTAYGSAVAQRLARDLAQRQLIIVSGLARGIDSASHRGALEAPGKTVKQKLKK